jgi:lipoprotein NlpI
MLQQACSIKPENSVACNNLGLSLFEAKEFEDANE